MSTYLQVVVFSLVGGLFSLAGGVLLLSSRRLAIRLASAATPFAAGALIAAAFFDLLPEALEHGAVNAAFRWAAAGMVIFFFLEHSLQWFHHHHEHRGKSQSQPTSLLIIIGDTIHNAIDGAAIGAAFLLSPATGIVTALAVSAHEIPQEIGDFGLLLKGGMRRSKVLLVNALSALATLVAALIVFRLGTSVELPLDAVLGLTAGFFIYIAASDLLPSIHEKSKDKFAKLDVVLLILGLVIVGVLTDYTHENLPTETHNHLEQRVDHERHSSPDALEADHYD